MPLKTFVPTVKADEEEEPQELVDPQRKLRSSCCELKSCVAFNEKYLECNDRVNSKSRTTETCSEELFDYLHCVEACVSKTLFSFLK